MGDQLSIADMPIATANKATSVVISPWVNEPHPPLHKLLSSHDVARLTRRPSWLLTSLSLIGRFPRKAKFHGRAIGWRQSEVLEWMARDLNVAERTTVPRVCPRHTRTAGLPSANVRRAVHAPAWMFEYAKAQAQTTRESSAMNAQPAPNDTLPRLLRLQQVGEITGLRRSMIYQLEADGNFPRRVKLATRAVGWVESEIRGWIAARIMIRDGFNQRAGLCDGGSSAGIGGTQQRLCTNNHTDARKDSSRI